MLLLTNKAGTRINPLGDQFSCGRAGLRPKAFPHLLAVPTMFHNRVLPEAFLLWGNVSGPLKQLCV